MNNGATVLELLQPATYWGADQGCEIYLPILFQFHFVERVFVLIPFLSNSRIGEAKPILTAQNG